MEKENSIKRDKTAKEYLRVFKKINKEIEADVKRRTFELRVIQIQRFATLLVSLICIIIAMIAFSNGNFQGGVSVVLLTILLNLMF